MNVFRFDGGVPAGCADWLREHVGPGKLPGSWPMKWEWEYERKTIVDYGYNIDGDSYYEEHHVPCITILDDTKAAMFILRWM